MAVRSTPADSTIYVGSLQGHVYAVTGPAAPVEVLNISGLIKCCGEQGLLGMTFSPDGTKLYVHYSAAGLGRHRPSTNTPCRRRSPPSSTAPRAATVLTAPGFEGNHNGGSLLFGPDTPTPMLYLAIGDGGGGNDGHPNYSAHPPGGHGQDITTLLGKVLRIDPTDPPAGGVGAGAVVHHPA